jgi:hypothetical protein
MCFKRRYFQIQAICQCLARILHSGIDVTGIRQALYPDVMCRPSPPAGNLKPWWIKEFQYLDHTGGGAGSKESVAAMEKNREALLRNAYIFIALTNTRIGCKL